MSQSEDIAAINRYIATTAIYTDDARDLKDDWIQWHDKLSWWEREMSRDTYDMARNKRNLFNLANVRTVEEKQHVQQTIKTGLSTEEIAGGTDRRLSSGEYTENSVSDGTKLTAAKWIVGIGGLWLVKKMTWDRLFE